MLHSYKTGYYVVAEYVRPDGTIDSSQWHGQPFSTLAEARSHVPPKPWLVINMKRVRIVESRDVEVHDRA